MQLRDSISRDSVRNQARSLIIGTQRKSYDVWRSCQHTLRIHSETLNSNRMPYWLANKIFTHHSDMIVSWLKIRPYCQVHLINPLHLVKWTVIGQFMIQTKTILESRSKIKKVKINHWLYHMNLTIGIHSWLSDFKMICLVRASQIASLGKCSLTRNIYLVNSILRLKVVMKTAKTLKITTMSNNILQIRASKKWES